MNKMNSIIRRLGQLIILLTITAMLGCIAAVPLVVMHYKSKQGYVARAEMPVPAEKVYRTAVSMVEERPDIKILDKNDDKRLIEVTDGVQTGSLKAVEVSSGKTEIIVTASVPKEEGQEKEAKKQKEKELSLRVIHRLCTRLEVKCTIKEE